MAGRVLGNNSLWSVEEAETHLRQAARALEAALVSAGKAAERGEWLQDLLVVAAVADVRVEVARAKERLAQAGGRLQDAKAGVWRGRLGIGD